MELMQKYHEVLHKYLENAVQQKEPSQLYEPIKYILELGGKRIRPALTLMVCEFFGVDFKKAIPAALAVEMFHNFSLIHDDIMDNAPLRRGQQTVHEKWDTNTAILSGDAMLILAYRFFEDYEPKMFRELAQLFSKTALQVCEGQQYDMDFETREEVKVDEYIDMINHKTAVLLGASMKMGAIVANAKTEESEKIYEFGRQLGIAFQLQDDYLDAFGNPETFGKQVGGDIISNKKTFLYLMAINKGSTNEKEELINLYSIDPKDSSGKIEMVKRIFLSTDAAESTKREIEKYSNQANEMLNGINISENKKELLREFGKEMMGRNV